MDTQIISERKFESLSDFNLVYLVSFERLKFEEMIIGAKLSSFEPKITVKTLFGKKIIDNPDLPERVIEYFKFSEEPILNDGIIYKKSKDFEGKEIIESFMDATNLVNNVIELPVLKYTLKTINDFLGKSIMTKDLLSLPGFKIIDNEVYGNISLKLDELSEKGNKVRKCKISLIIEKDNLTTSVDLGILNYSIYGRRL
jgi:hypothetical protein